jgi:hypothetical protein
MHSIRGRTAQQAARLWAISISPRVEPVERRNPEHTLRVKRKVPNQGQRRALTDLVSPPRDAGLIGNGYPAIFGLRERAWLDAPTPDRLKRPPSLRKTHFVTSPCVFTDGAPENHEQEQTPHSQDAIKMPARPREPPRARVTRLIVKKARHASPFRKLRAESHTRRGAARSR